MSLQSKFTSAVNSAALTAKGGNLTVDAGWLQMADADARASGSMSLSGTKRVELGELDRRLNVTFLPLNDKRKEDSGVRKLSGQGVTLDAQGGNLSITSTDDMTLVGANVKAKGNVALTAHGSKLALQSGKVGLVSRLTYDGNAADLTRYSGDEDLTPTVVQAGGRIDIVNDGARWDGVQQAGDVWVVSSVLNAGYKSTVTDLDFANAKGNLAINGRSNVTIAAEEEDDWFNTYHYTKKDTMFGLGKKVTITKSDYAANYDVEEAGQQAPQIQRYASQLAADNIKINSDLGNVKFYGALSQSETDTTLLAPKGSVVLEAPVFTSTFSESIIKKKSGIIADDFFKTFNFTVGSIKESLITDKKFVYRASNLLDAFNKATITAGANAEISGSNVMGGNGVSITGRDVLIDTALGSYEMSGESSYKAVGLNVGLTGAVIGGLITGQSLLEKADAATDNKLSSIYKLHAGVAAIAAVEDGIDTVSALKNYLNNEATPSGVFDEFSGGKSIGVSAAFGVTKRKTTTNEYKITGLGSSVVTYDVDLAKKSGESDASYQQRQIAAGTAGVSIQATGKGESADKAGHIWMNGSVVRGGTVTLTAPTDISLNSFESTRWQSTMVENKSASLGVSAYVSTTMNAGVFVDAGGAYSTASTESTEKVHTENRVTAGNTLTVNAGDDFYMAGAQIKGDKVTVDVAGNMSLTSLQDYSKYTRKSFSAKGNVSIPVYGAATSTVVAGGVTTANTSALHKSVVDKTAIIAGTGGFDVNVLGSTALTGAVVVSEDTGAKNSFVTNTLSHKSIENESKIDSKTEGFNISISGDLANATEGMKSFADFKSWADIVKEIKSDVLASAAKSLLTNASTGLAVDDGAKSITHSGISAGYLKVQSGGGDKGLRRHVNASSEALAKVYDLKKMAEREAYAFAVYDASMAALDVVAELQTESAKTEMLNGYASLTAAQKTALGSADGTASAISKALNAYTGSDAGLLSLVGVNEKLGSWNKSGTTPGSSVAILRGGLEVMKATMADKKVMAGGTGLFIAQMANSITDSIVKDTSLYNGNEVGSAFQAILKP